MALTGEPNPDIVEVMANLSAYSPGQSDLWQFSNGWEDVETDWDDTTDLIISMMAQRVDPMAEEVQWCHVTASDIFHIKGGRDNGTWKRVEKVAENLSEAQVKMRDEASKSMVIKNVFEETVVKGGTSMYAKFSAGMAPLVLHRRKNYTGARLRAISRLRGHNRRLYKMMIRFLDKGHRTFTYDDLRIRLKVAPDSYQAFGSFEQKVLKRAQSVIAKNPFSEFTFTWTKKKGARGKVTHVIFHMTEKSFVEIVDGIQPNSVSRKLLSPMAPKTGEVLGFEAWCEKNQAIYLKKRYEALDVLNRQTDAFSREPEDMRYKSAEIRVMNWYFKDGPGASKSGK
jgi:hypothetical protein